MSKYVVLRRDGSGLWEFVGANFEASSATGAIRKASQGVDGEFVAVPQKSWQPVAVRTETKTVVRIGSPPSP